MRVYFDNASTTPLLSEVKDEMKKVVDDVYGNPSSIHLQGRQSRILVEEARKTVANTLQASTGEIFFTSGATEANNMILVGAVRDLGVERVISTQFEHHCILHTLEHLPSSVEVVLLPVNDCGELDLINLESLLADNSKKTLVSIMHANNELGTLSDMHRISQLCHKHQALYHSDTAQTIGKQPIDVSKIPIDFLCGASHKFHGPKGVGFVFIRNESMLKPMFHGGNQERGLRSGTENIYGIAGMSKALSLAVENMENRHNYILNLRNYFKDQMLSTLEDIRFNESKSNLPNILSVSFPPSPKAEMLIMNLDIAGIASSSGSACSSGVEQDSHVLQAINHDTARKAIRFSFSHFNTNEEVDYVVNKLKTITPTKSE